MPHAGVFDFTGKMDMKKKWLTVFLGLWCIVALLEGCKNIEEKEQPEEMPKEVISREEISQEEMIQEDEEFRMNEPYAEYVKKYEEMAARYGEPDIYSVKDNYGFGVCYLTGVCGVNLMDYNGDGMLDLFLLYADGEPKGVNMNEHPIPLSDYYKVEIWTLEEGEMKQLLMVDHVSSFKTFQTSYWDSDECYLTVFENEEGMPVVQICEEKKEMCCYTNYYYQKEGTVKDTYQYEGGIYRCNQKTVSKEEFIKATAGYDTVLMNAYLSSNDISLEYLWEYHIDIPGVLEETKDVAEALKENKSAFFKEIRADYIPIYEEVLMSVRLECIDRRAEGFPGDFDYVLYDIDQNQIPELIIKSGTCEADYLYEIYTIENDSAVLCGEYSGFHSSLYISGEKGLVRYMGQMGGYEIMHYSLYGTEIVEKEIASGWIDWEEDYPDLNEYGYGEYDMLLGLGRGNVSYALYEAAGEEALTGDCET